MVKAAFTLEKYWFDKVTIDFSNHTTNDLDISFEPSGVFKLGESIFELKFTFIAHNSAIDKPFVRVDCIGIFKFQEKISFEEIPTFFYKNSIAILFPYVRAFVSTVTLQANIPPIILPTMNLSSLEVPLKEKTTIN